MMEFDMKFTDKRNRVWEVFVDYCYYECVCVISKQSNKEMCYDFTSDVQ